MNHPTIRAIAGAAAPARIEAASTALLVIDFQNEYFSGKMPIPDGKRALGNARRLVEFADQAGIPVFHVQHVTPAGTPIFAEGGATVQFHEELQPAAHHSVLQKSSVSVFPTTDIDSRLKAAGIKTLIVSGLMTHACVAGAARDAVPLGYEVLVAEDACATRDLDSADGAILPHAALHRASLATIADTFGEVMTTAQILQLPLA
ncbi:isochorismatase family protein [Collimonas fungivorans]|uniref:Isochorismatase family protein n=1 Tax=Collimonas fungivorans TaxID=158899 RepID=A0A127PG16_9BURK|nr:cysteine hydrolase family protein [Collimonas fungivorans]AMO96746.1 isochorismatase family protein [Collimonas fungivorans]